MSPVRLAATLALALGLSHCTQRLGAADAGSIPDAGAPIDAPSATCATEGEGRCVGLRFERCTGATFTPVETCSTLCRPTLGCVDCDPALERTCIGGNVRACTEEGLIGPVLETCEAAAPCEAGYCGGCAADTDLVYLLDAGAHLHAFDPRTLALVDRGAIDCPATGSASPYSMAVDRRGFAWVLYDSGELFEVDIADARCAATEFEPDQLGLHTFGMGFVHDIDAGTETLYVAGGPSNDTAATDTTFGTLDTSSLRITEIGPLTTLGPYFPELTGDAAGGLYGYFPSDTYPSRVSTIRRESGRIGPTWDAVALDPSTRVQAWAFARWGGDFYVIVAVGDVALPAPTGSDFFRLDPDTGELTYLRSDFRAFVGAGVSTCAPLVF